MLRELLPVVIAATIFGPEWRNSVVMFQCDNKGAVATVNSGYSRVQGILHLLRCLFFIRAHYRIHIRTVHIPGSKNALADAVSCDNLSLLFSQVRRQHLAIPQYLGSAGSSGQEASGMHISILVQAVQELFEAGIANSTQKVYQSGDECYNDFCSNFCLRLWDTH